LILGSLFFSGPRGCFWKMLKATLLVVVLLAACVSIRCLYRNTAQMKMDDSALFHRATLEESVLTMKTLLLWTKVDMPDNAGETPLFVAAYWGKDKAVKLLLESGANANARNIKGMTPLDACLANPLVWREMKRRVLDLLLAHDAKSSKELNAIELSFKPVPPAKTAEQWATEYKEREGKLEAEYKEREGKLEAAYKEREKRLAAEEEAADNAIREKVQAAEKMGKKLTAEKDEALRAYNRAWTEAREALKIVQEVYKFCNAVNADRAATEEENTTLKIKADTLTLSLESEKRLSTKLARDLKSAEKKLDDKARAMTNLLDSPRERELSDRQVDMVVQGYKNSK